MRLCWSACASCRHHAAHRGKGQGVSCGDAATAEACTTSIWTFFTGKVVIKGAMMKPNLGCASSARKSSLPRGRLRNLWLVSRFLLKSARHVHCRAKTLAPTAIFWNPNRRKAVGSYRLLSEVVAYHILYQLSEMYITFKVNDLLANRISKL